MTGMKGTEKIDKVKHIVMMGLLLVEVTSGKRYGPVSDIVE
jgi:hypothetical protein